MRIRVYTDELLLMDTNLDNLKLVNPELKQEDNKAGSFTFTIYPEHSHFNLIQRMKSIITVYEDKIDEPLFRGRVFDEKQGFYNEKQVSCEGELAFFNDSIQRPYSFKGTPAELFTQYIENHNAQVDSSRQFAIGRITVTDSNDYIVRSNSDYVSTWKEINEKLIKLLGGHIWVRHENGINYIDYLSDFDVLSNQPIEFGKNLLDLKKNIKVNGFATALIPLGAKIKDEQGNDTGKRLTIESVNDGVDYVYNKDAVEQNGYIYMTHVWDDVTEAVNLKRKGQAFIDDAAQFIASIEVSAADMNGATIEGVPVQVNSFRTGRYVKITTKPHSLVNANFMISKLSRKLLQPQATKLVLGTTYKTLTERQSEMTGQKGEQGIPGKDGVDGAKGDKGEPGPPGEKGEPGKDGTDGAKGDKGEPGADGADGKGIEKTVTSYQVSSSGTTVPTGAWSSTIPPVKSNQYLWTRTVITYTDKTTNSFYIVSKMGADGQNGAQGPPGKDGADGAKGDKGEPGKDGADGKDAAIQSTTAPADKNYMWLDISTEPPVLKRWNGESWVIVNDYSGAITILEQRFAADIASTEKNFARTLTESYCTKNDAQALVSAESTKWEQTAKGFEMLFESIEKNLNDVIGSTDSRFQEISKYIRFVAGCIILGRSDSPLILKIESDSISFIQNNTKVAYFSNNRLYVTDGVFTHSLTIGIFGWIPRNNGNLSLKKL